MADKMVTYIPIEVEEAIVKYVLGESVWVQNINRMSGYSLNGVGTVCHCSMT
ncbi:hypothetical protein [Thermoactinomyces mirandus]|uniref:Uncharacterized protein n=1 Tax=Thermoactinomyces mirandus TaxID=2756294 RepID=A0A7W2ARJ5_9BACL|nr:hypothetical protein [Thermoactinomyces mirandus]MBA4601640.1 hypothetical protein [Thermoactinomyces mirandus]